MNRRTQVVVAGGGIVGLAAANLLARIEALDVILVDAGDEAGFRIEDEVSLRVSAVSPGSVGLLTDIGAWPRIIAQRVCPYRDMKVWDAAGNVDGPETLSFEAAEFALPQLGFIVENVLLRWALQEQLKTTAVCMHFNTRIEAIRQAGSRYAVELSSASGSARTLNPDLLIGADGAKSVVRSSANLPVRSWPHKQKAFVTNLQPEYSHRFTAWQRFASDGPIGLLPLHDGRLSTVWSTTPEKADAALAMSDEELGVQLTAMTDGVLGQLRPLGSRGAFPLHSQHAQRYATPGLVLVGDAAHAIHPLAGQGVNLGLADVATLTGIISSELDRGENIGDLPILRKYERARMGANQIMLSFVDGLNRLFTSDSVSLARLRGVGMHAFNKSGPIRTRAVRVALGIK